MQKNYRRTLIACYLGFITQAIKAIIASQIAAGTALISLALLPELFTDPSSVLLSAL